MSPSRFRGVLAAAALTTAVAAPGARADTLIGRATYPVETRETGTIPAPAPFRAQPVGGYSALLDAGAGRYWAMPDNGYGSKANSPDFVLRVDLIRPEFRTRRGGEGDIEIIRSIYLRDPDGRIPFAITDSGATASGQRLLTGSDFDPESMRIGADGTFWFGDEFGPFLVHTDRQGRVLDAPIPLPGVRAPENPLPGGPPNLGSSSGFEGMASSVNGRYLYASLERALTDDPNKTRRYIYEFDTRREGYTGRRWQYRATPAFPTEPPGQDQHVIGDLTVVRGTRLVVIERDFRQGAGAVFSKVFSIDLRRTDPDGFLVKREIVDLLEISDPFGISLQGPVRTGDFGLGDPFEFPYVTTESVLPERNGRVLTIANDNNFGSVGGRNPALPDYNDVVQVVPDRRP